MVCGMERLIKGAAGALVLFLLIPALVSSGPAYAKTRQYDLSPPPRWVQPITGVITGRSPRETPGGTAYLLVDRQIRVQGGWAEYQRYVTQVVNPAGVEDGSELTIDFDPALDHLILHAVTVRRGARVIDELRRGRIQVLQRESELDQGLLNGSLTFQLLMRDVRVGDIIDESYTIEHREPELGNRFFERLTTRWDDPVTRSRLRVLVPEAEPLSIGGTEPSAPVKRHTGGWQILEWNWNGLPAVVADEDAPGWYQQYPAIQFSQFANWAEVARASLPLYSFDPRDPDLVAISGRLKSSANTQSGRALAAVRFVQEKITYTGLELGSGAFRPRPPGEVLRSRYGDCKDKTLLAVALLRSMGIDAAPALVSTRWEGHLNEHLPSPGDFDHVVVRLPLAGKTYWVDVTETAQGGVLETLDQADFGQALVISPGVSGLEPIPREVPVRPLVTVTAVFDLRAGEDAEGSYTLSTVYRGSEADSMRRRLRRTSAAELGRNYLNYYKRRYPGIRAVGPPDIRDDLLANQITANEAYRIEHPFAPMNPGRRRFELRAEIIGDYAQSTDQPVRNAPVSLDYPVNVAEQITIRLPSYFPIKDEVVRIDHPAFHYESHLTHNGSDVFFDIRYRTLADEVPTDQLDGFLTKMDDVHQDDSLEFTSNDRGAAGTNTIVFRRTHRGSVISRMSMFIIALSLTFGAWYGWRVLRYDPTPEQAEPNAPTGIRGWLVLPAIAVAIGPVVILCAFVGWIFLPRVHEIGRQPWHYYAYLALLAAVCVQLVGTVVTFILFFRKRSSAPAVVVALMWYTWVISLAMDLLYVTLGINHRTFLGALGSACAQLFVLGALSLYFFGSRRVNATFTSRRAGGQ